MPFVAADVAFLARAVELEQPSVPHLVVGVVDLHAVVVEALDVGLGERLGDDLAGPAAGEAFLDRLGVVPVEVRLVAALEAGRDGAAGEGVGGARPGGVVAVDDVEGLEHLLDVLDARVGAACRLVLAPVVVDVAVLALLLGTEVLADAEDREVDQIAPLDGGRHLHDGLSVGQGLTVVVRHRGQAHVGDAGPVEVEPEDAVVPGGDAVRRGGVDPHRHHRTAEVVGPSGEHDLLGRTAQRRGAQLGQRAVVEGEDEVRLGLDVPVLVVAEGGVVERHAAAQQVLLEDGLSRHMGEPLHELLHQTRPLAGDGGAGGAGFTGVRHVRAPRVRCSGRCCVYATLSNEPAAPSVRG